MKKSFGEKLKQARNDKKLKQSELAKQLGVTNTTVSNWENNISKPDLDMLSYICGALEVKVSYFLEAKLPEGEISISEFDIIKKYRALDAEGKSHVDIILSWETDRMNALDKLRDRPAAVIELQPRRDTTYLSEYFRSASAGGGVFILGNEATAKIAIPEEDWNPLVDYVISVSGTSMEPDFCDGDKVMVSHRVEMRHGDVGIFVVNGKAYIKEYGETELISRNPDAGNIPIAEYDNIVCMGKVIGKLHGGYEIVED